MDMDETTDRINEYARDILARTKARAEILKIRGNQTPAGQEDPVPSSSLPPAKVVRFSNMTDSPDPKVTPSSRDKENLEISTEEMDMEESFGDEEDEDEEEVDDKKDDDEGMEIIDDDEEEGDDEEMDKREQSDELLPLNVLASKPLSRALQSVQSASPISRKSRLSALAESINSWEDDLTPSKLAVGDSVQPATNVKKGPRYSVSTPPVQGASRGRRSSNCHQFVATATTTTTPIRTGGSGSGSVSPGKRTTGQIPVTPASDTSFASTSPSKRSLTSSPVKSISSSSPTKVLSSPKRKIAPAAVAHASVSPVRQIVSPKKSSPIKTMQVAEEDDAVAKNLEFQGFVKVDPTNTTSPAVIAPPKIAGSILNKKRIFEKDVESNSSPPKVPKSLISTSKPAWPEVAAIKLQKPVAPASPNLPQFHSRKSLQVDPSELSVAQKAKLFEKQQKEQEQLKIKEDSTNKWLNMGRNRNNAANPATTPAITPASTKSEIPKKYYFGQAPSVPATSSTIPPPPPPLPKTVTMSPAKVTSPSKPVLRVEEEIDTSDDDEEETSSNKSNVSPSMLIAQSVRPIKVVQKEDKMYPSLTDIDNTETEDNETNTSSVGSSPAASCSFNSSMSTSSLGSFIQSKATKSAINLNSEINTTMACQQIDDLIDEALEGQITDDTFMMDSAVPLQASSPIAKPQHHVPLVHSVSMYRRNQRQLKKAEDETFKVPQNVDKVLVEEEDEEDLHDRIQQLEQQVYIQQKAISQASMALNVCESSFEFSNSTENIEGERALLIATQKRSQILSYINKLRNGKKNEEDFSLSPSKDKFRPSSSTKGTMKIDTLQLYPVKSARLHQDYAYHFIVILKYNDNVFTTSVIKTSGSSTIIEFPNEFIIPELDAGFKVQVEVYALRTFKQTDVIPHHMKYHIKNPNAPQGSSSSTPSKGSTLSHFLTPTRSSKHTPKATDLKSTPAKGKGAANSSSVIRTSNFTLQSVLNLNLSNLNKTEWEMSMVNSNLLLPNISMRIKCTNKNELNFKGFLTVFSDVGGLGAWHRRWAMLDEDFRMLFWTYPEDEHKPPVLTIELSSCITPRISPAPRDICARPNTFLLVTTRPPLPTDKDSLVMAVHEEYTAIKNMFFADHRSERDAWIDVINKTLTNMRAWGINELSSSSK